MLIASGQSPSWELVAGANQLTAYDRLSAARAGVATRSRKIIRQIKLLVTVSDGAFARPRDPNAAVQEGRSGMIALVRTLLEPPEVEAPAPSGTMNVRVLRAALESRFEQDDRVAVEGPLEFLLQHPSLGLEPISFGTTMRTPGDDENLAVGLLYGEGIVNQPSDIDAVESSTRRPNIVNVRLRPEVRFELQPPTRRFSAGSSCGVCGTTGLDDAIARAAATRIAEGGGVELSVLLSLPGAMRKQQSKFGDTGGVHAAALFDFTGNLQDIAEDVGRHNALDKLVGRNLMAGRLPLREHIVLLSGRASYELIQKSLRAGIAVLAAIGAPSSLAVNLARASGLTLVGFVRSTHCNVYSNPQRLTCRRATASAPDISTSASK
jgi:FdhD protein